MTLELNVDSPPKHMNVKILIIEDDPDDLHATERMLTDYQVTAARSLAVGLDALAEPFDIVLLDLALPDSDGPNAIAQILEKANVAVIVLTGLQDEEVALRALNLGAQDYFVKGHFGIDSLSMAVQQAIERKRGMSGTC